MDGGVGESMLLGAALGGGTSALMGGDPLKGALMGGATGGAMGFINPSATIAESLAPDAQEELSRNLATMQMNGATDVEVGNVMKAYGYSPEQISAYQSPADGTFQLGAPSGTFNYANPAASTNALGIGNISNKQLALAAGAGGIGALLNSKPSYLNPFQPKTAAQSGMPTGTLAANYRPWRPYQYAEGGKIPDLQVGPGSVATSGVAPSDLNIQKPQDQALTMSDIQGLAQRYGYNVPGMAEGGIAGLDQNTMYPQSQQQTSRYAVPSQLPVGADSIRAGAMQPTPMAKGGIADLGGYSDGGRMLKGPGDGMSDSIPASIGGKQPARLADGEFVVPADVVSHLGNGSTDAGAKQLYSMMDKVRTARTGTKKQGKQINPNKFVPK